MDRMVYYDFLAYSIVLMCSSFPASAQQPKPPADRPAELTLTMEASPAKVQGLPRAIIVKLTNVSDHNISIPQPNTACSDGMHGTLFFRIAIKPATGPIPATMGCFADYNFAQISVWDRLKAWKRLGPGQALTFEKNVTGETEAILRGPLRNGMYEFSAYYEPPYLSEHDKELLREAKDDFPQYQMQTPILVFKIAKTEMKE
jgi:hypothetical protein